MLTSAPSRGRVLPLATRGRAALSDLQAGGSLLTLAGSIILLGIITAEALYPVAYSTGRNDISDLGGTLPPEGLVYQPSATIFDVSMIVVGLLVIVAAVLVYRAFGRRSVTIPIALLGLGALGVGVFPGNTGTPHTLLSMVTFISGGIAAVASARVITGPFRYLSALLGAISLFTLVAYMLLRDAAPMAGLGQGGVERWIVYPIALWVIAFGGYLAGRREP